MCFFYLKLLMWTYKFVMMVFHTAHSSSAVAHSAQRGQAGSHGNTSLLHPTTCWVQKWKDLCIGRWRDVQWQLSDYVSRLKNRTVYTCVISKVKIFHGGIQSKFTSYFLHRILRRFTKAYWMEAVLCWQHRVKCFPSTLSTFLHFSLYIFHICT